MFASSHNTQKVHHFKESIRQTHLKRNRQAIIFNLQAHELIQNQQHHSAHQGLPAHEELARILEHQDIKQLYEFFSDCSIEGVSLADEHCAEIVQIISRNIGRPQAIFLLGKLAVESIPIVRKAYEDGCVQKVAHTLKQLKNGSKQQGIYVYVLCQLTFRTELVDLAQISDLCKYIEQIFYDNVVSHKEDNSVIRLVSHLCILSQAELHFSGQMIELLCDEFWKVESKINSTNIYIALRNAVINGIHINSAQAVRSLLKVLIEGSQSIAFKVENKCVDRFNLLSALFKQLRDSEISFDRIIFKSQSQAIEMTISQYFLHQYPYIVEDVQPNLQYINFISELTQFSEMDTLMEFFVDRDLFQPIINQMDICNFELSYLTLKVIRFILFNSKESSKIQIGEYLISLELRKYLEQFVYHERQTKIGLIAEDILSMITFDP